MIEFREYNSNDLGAYKRFCLKNFGSNKHQQKSSYLNWLYAEENKSFSIASFKNDIVGIIHNFKAPIIINGKIQKVTVLHDLMVDKNFRGNVGLQLISSALNSDDYTVLPGSVGRIARVYSRLGSKQFNSYWYKKFLIPKSIFFERKLRYIEKYQALAEKKDFLLGCNKGHYAAEFLEKGLTEFIKNTEYIEFFKWRFLNNNAPLTFFLSDTSGKNTVLFIIGKRGIIPYLRIFYTNYDKKSLLSNMIKFIESFASGIGIPIILFTSFECSPPENLRYRPYKPMPVSFVFSRIKTLDFVPKVPSFCSDISFEGLNCYE